MIWQSQRLIWYIRLHSSNIWLVKLLVLTHHCHLSGQANWWRIGKLHLWTMTRQIPSSSLVRNEKQLVLLVHSSIQVIEIWFCRISLSMKRKSGVNTMTIFLERFYCCFIVIITVELKPTPCLFSASRRSIEGALSVRFAVHKFLFRFVHRNSWKLKVSLYRGRRRIWLSVLRIGWILIELFERIPMYCLFVPFVFCIKAILHWVSLRWKDAKLDMARENLQLRFLPQLSRDSDSEGSLCSTNSHSFSIVMNTELAIMSESCGFCVLEPFDGRPRTLTCDGWMEDTRIPYISQTISWDWWLAPKSIRNVL